MNIREAKEEIEKAVRAYMARTDAGTLRVPLSRQRPLLLIGPPGIGKTAIMEQIARECGIGLVSYTMTHHTRQSAIGLPVLEQKQFGGKNYTVTSYTMSEIIASVYEQIEISGCKGGILFLDEINCVSETLMPAMLEFLQYKNFGGHRLPEGWILVAAGNPSAYNRSVREFDTVTLDRVRRMEVKPDLGVWREYAADKGLHPAILSFLQLRPERFYVMEPGHTGFVTGRAWEDLSEILLTMEELDLGVEETLFAQYLQDEDTALEFAFYYRIYQKWKEQLQPEAILSGGREKWEKLSADNHLPSLPFNERLCIVWLLLQRLLSMAAVLREQQKLSESLRYFSDSLSVPHTEGKNEKQQEELLQEQIQERLNSRQKGLAVRKENGLLDSAEEEREQIFFRIVQACREQLRLTGDTAAVEERSRREIAKTEIQRQALVSGMENGVLFVRCTFGEGQEMVVFLTGLTQNPVCKGLLEKELSELWEENRQILNAEEREKELRQRIGG